MVFIMQLQISKQILLFGEDIKESDGRKDTSTKPAQQCVNQTCAKRAAQFLSKMSLNAYDVA
jgi:hypothetical protein